MFPSLDCVVLCVFSARGYRVGTVVDVRFCGLLPTESWAPCGCLYASELTSRLSLELGSWRLAKGRPKTRRIPIAAKRPLPVGPLRRWCACRYAAASLILSPRAVCLHFVFGLAAAQTRPRRTQPANPRLSPRHSCTAGSRSDHGCAGGSFPEFRRPPAGPRPGRAGARPPPALVAAARQSWRPGAAAALAVQHTHVKHHEHRSLTRPRNAGPRGLPQVHLERREARQAPGFDPTVLEGHRQIPADDAEARLRRRV